MTEGYYLVQRGTAVPSERWHIMDDFHDADPAVLKERAERLTEFWNGSIEFRIVEVRFL